MHKIRVKLKFWSCFHVLNTDTTKTKAVLVRPKYVLINKHLNPKYSGTKIELVNHTKIAESHFPNTMIWNEPGA